MFQTDLNHHEVVSSSLSGKRAVDEQTFASIAVLQDRLEQVRKRDKIFAEVGFSPALRQLAMQQDKVAVG